MAYRLLQRSKGRKRLSAWTRFLIRRMVRWLRGAIWEGGWGRRWGWRRLPDAPQGQGSFPEAICHSASSAASTIGASIIVAFSERGTTARLLSKQRPDASIISLTPFED